MQRDDLTLTSAAGHVIGPPDCSAGRPGLAPQGAELGPRGHRNPAAQAKVARYRMRAQATVRRGKASR